MAVLIFSKTSDYRHESIAAGVAALRAWAHARQLRLEATEDARCFTPER